MTERIITDSNGRKHITNEPLLHPQQPAQEPQVRTGNCLLCGVCASEGHKIQAKRPWVGLTEAQFLEAARLAETGNYLVAFQRIQQWLQELNT